MFSGNQSEPSLLDDMNDYLDEVHQESQKGVPTHEKVIMPSTNATIHQENLRIFYEKLEAMGMNLEELKPILEAKGNILVLAIAGAGKTTALVLKIIRDILAGETFKTITVNSAYGQTTTVVPVNILVSTFLRTGKMEMEASLRDWVNKLGVQGIDFSNIRFKTIHAEVLNALTDMGVAMNVTNDPSKYLKKVVTDLNIRNVTATSPKITLDEMRDIESIVTFARNRLDNKRYENALADEYRLDTLTLDLLLKEFRDFKALAGVKDFEDMQEMLLEGLQTNPAVREFIANRYDYIFVDEFQDTSQLQYEILKYYFVGSKNNFIIGDDDQAIYSFRGSDNDIIVHRFIADFDPIVLASTTNYRCADNILAFVKPSIEKNQNRHPKQLRTAKPDGEINIITNATVNELIDNVHKDLANNYSVGVLARVNSDLLIPAMILELDNKIEFTISKSVNMESRLAKQVFGALDLVTKRYTENFQTLLRMFVSRNKWYEADNLAKILKSNTRESIFSLTDADLQQSVPSLYPFLRDLRQMYETNHVQAYLFILGVMEQTSYSGTSVWATKAREMTVFVRQLIEEHPVLKDKSLTFIDDLFNHVLPERLKRRVDLGKSGKVKLTTVHEAKGKEWDSVYIWNNVQKTFPNSVGNREMTDEEYEEERRVHYIACTRPRKKLTIFTIAGREGDFLQECDLSLANVDTDSEEHKRALSEPMTVFKQANNAHLDESLQTPHQLADTLLTKYIEYAYSGSASQADMLNADLVTSKLQKPDVVDLLVDKYGVHVTKLVNAPQEEAFEDLKAFFNDIANQIFNEGDFSAN